jgi:Tol biopolymer transport system component
MPLTAGAHLGPYQIQSVLGAGGMGEVYRARDARLDRTVAIKVLPPHVAADPAARQRFEREARTLAVLSHPHICPVFDIGDQDGVLYLVMEHLEGETLAERLARGALPLDRALRYAIDIADGLDKAHRKGIVHRDLKPGNIFLAADGGGPRSGAASLGHGRGGDHVTIKLLDFGLAKLQPSPAVSALSAAPTEQSPVTLPGTILGTLQYMAPEQLEGQEADARTDLFAFGAVLYEMLSGRKAFSGKSQASLISAIMSSDPPALSSLQAMSPPALDHLVRRCLAKDPEDRWQDARDLRDQLRWISESAAQQTPAEAGVAGGPGPTRPRVTMVAIAAMLLGAVAAGAAAWVLTRPAPTDPPQVSRTVVQTAPLSSLAGGILAISPDGKRIAYLADEPQGRGSAVWVRDLDRLEPHIVPESEIPRGAPGNGNLPFFSPDGRWIGFRSQGRGIMRAAIDGGPPLEVVDEPQTWLGGAWGPDDTLVFWQGGELFRAPVSGGVAPEQVSEGVMGGSRPRVLPGGRAVLFQQLTPQGPRVAVLDLASRAAQVLIEPGSSPFYAPTGHLVFGRGSTLMAAPFDLDRLVVTGEPVPLLDGLRAGDWALSENGTLVYVPAGDTSPDARAATLIWVTRAGQILGPAVNASLDNPRNIRLSPDGQRLAVITGLADASGGGELWLHELDGRPATLLFGPQSQRYIQQPIWSPDGTRVAFSWGPPGSQRIHWLPADGSDSDPRPIEAGVGIPGPTAWLREDELLFDTFSGRANSDVRKVPVAGGPPQDLVASEYLELHATRSPDGRWLTYEANRSGQNDVWVRAYAGGAPVRVSPAGGVQPVWSRDGRELFYLQGTTMMAVAVRPGTETSAFDEARALFDASFARLEPGAFEPGGSSYDVAPDGRFLMIQPVARPQTAPTGIVVVQNWLEELKRHVPVR